MGIYRGAGCRGISRYDEIDLRRSALTKWHGEGVSDIVNVYLTLVVQLAELGF